MTSDIAEAAKAVDLDWVRQKYRAEREKRLHPAGSRQFRRITDELAHFAADPHTDLVEREPVDDLVDVAVIGGGFGGLLIGARLRQAGLDSIRLVEQGGDFGGTWYWNRYPGAACDTESYIYMPLLEETGYIPTEKYAKGPEILEHARRIARHFDLYRNALLHTTVTEIRWDECELVWVIATNRDERFRARFVAITTGPMSKAKLPGVDGIDDFQGKAFHTARWDYEYTGGDSSGNLTNLADKRVAIVGTGASGIQCVPHVARSAEHLFLFQRTPSAINVRANRATDPAWAAALEPGWQRRRMDNFSTFVAGGDAETDLVNDGWTALYRLRSLGNGVLDEREDYVKMEEIRGRVDSVVRDRSAAEALKPWYRALCKRPCFHDEYLDAFNLPNVTLVDTLGKGIERITARGVVANGVEHEVDCIIFASGFQTGGALRRRVGYEVVGPGGLTLTEKWKGGISTFFGMQTSGFPNCFIVQLAQTGVSSNQTHVLDVQSRHIAFVVAATRERGAITVQPSDEAEDAWVQECIESSRANIEFLASCTPGYYNNEGQPTLEGSRRNGAYSPGIVAFDKKLEAWKNDPQLPGLVFAHAAELVA